MSENRERVMDVSQELQDAVEAVVMERRAFEGDGAVPGGSRMVRRVELERADVEAPLPFEPTDLTSVVVVHLSDGETVHVEAIPRLPDSVVWDIKVQQ